jgi:hypothetical protein
MRTRAALGAALICCAILPLLSGCSLWNRVFHRDKSVGCTEKPFALNTDTRPPLKVPDGMSASDTRNGVKVPALGSPERVRAVSEPCLSRPPSYFSKPLNITLPTPPPKPKRWWQFWRKKPGPAPAPPTLMQEPASAAPAPAAPAPTAPAPSVPSAPSPAEPAPAPATPPPATPK